jgi:ribonuclease E
MPKEMLINVSEGEECRIALLEDGRLEELYMERTSATSHVGNIYKGRVTNVEPSIQAAFVDFGLGRNGFLHISDLMPTYFGRKGEDIQESVGRKMSRRDRPPIQRCLRRGDEIVVQIIKEGIGTKGPTLSTYLSIPGKILVMMPGMGKMGVSKKIEDEQERRRLRQILDGLKPPKDVAFIIRTAGIGKTKQEIERDLKYLTRLWETLVKKEQEPGPVELYTEGDLVTRTVRDLFSADVERIVVDNKEVAKRVKEVIKISSPRARNRVDVYENAVPLFHQANIEREIELMYSRHVPLPSGGSLVIDSTEAVVAIDVNSGKFRDHNDAEMTAFKTDMEAADEIPRQLKLRDLGGVIICDFIDLRFERHRRELEERLFENFKNDRAKTKVLRMSQFGIIEITRQRMRPSLKRSIYYDCPHCKGAGLIKTPESLNLDVMRKLAIALNDLKVVRVELSVCPDIAFYLLNTKRAALTELEARTKKKILIRTDAKLSQDELKFELFDSRDFPVILEEIGMTLPERPHTTQLGNRPPGHTAQGRGGRSDNRNNRNNNRKGPSRPLPTRPVDDDDDDLEEDRTNLDRAEDGADEMEDAGRRGLEPAMEREEDPTDIPAILETEAGDEIAEEYADEEAGEGQHADEAGGEQPPRRSDFRGQPQGQRPQQNRQQNQPQNQPPKHQPQNSNQSNANRPPGQFNDDQSREGGGRRGRRRRGRRGRGGQGQNQGGQGNNNFQGEPNGNMNPAARRPQDEYRDDDRVDAEGYPIVDDLPEDRSHGDVDRTDDTLDDTADEMAAESADRANTPDAEPPVRTDGPGLGPDQKPRRRRRRGGRRHRRRNGQGNENALPIGERSPQDSDQPRQPFGGNEAGNQSVSEFEDEFETTEIEETGVFAQPEELKEFEDDGVEQEAEVLEIMDAPAAEPLVGEASVADAPLAEAPVADETVAEAPVEEATPKPRTRAKRATKPKAPKAAKAAPKRIPPKRSKAAKEEKEAAQSTEPDAPQPAVVKTGSADKHLISDEPVTPQPLSRPRSYSDLDAIPDDYD